MLAPGTAVASLQSVDPIYADFWLPQKALAVVQPGQAVQVKTDIFPGSTWVGKVSVINTEVDSATRNVKVRATLRTPTGDSGPGMFVSVEVLSPETGPVLLIPATSVLFAPYGDSVFVLRKGGAEATAVAQQRFVRLGERRGDFVAVM